MNMLVFVSDGIQPSSCCEKEDEEKSGQTSSQKEENRRLQTAQKNEKALEDELHLNKSYNCLFDLGTPACLVSNTLNLTCTVRSHLGPDIQAR